MAQVNVRNVANGGPTLLASEGGSIAGQQVRLHNKGAASVFLGGAAVTVAAGYELATGELLSINLTEASQALYAVSTTDGQRVDVLVV